MIKEVTFEEKESFNKLAIHPLQSWEWGEFRKKTGIEVVRLGRLQNDKLVETAQITIHQIPFTNYTIGYFPKGNIPNPEMMEALTELGKKYKCIFIKFEPNVLKDIKILRYKDIKKKKKFLNSIIVQLIFPLEYCVKILQLWLINKHKTTEAVSDRLLAFHPIDYRKRTLAELSKRLEAYGAV